MPEVEGCAGIHVRADGYDLLPIIAEEPQHKQFLYIQRTAQAVNESRDLVGNPVSPPQTVSPYRLTRADS
jgi:hypothetical protein